jgi:hypothetical protein
LFTCVASEDGLPTVLFEEIDTVFGPKAKDSNEDVRGFLNAGHRKGAVFGRAVYLGNGKRRAEELPAYCAVALAGLGWLPDTILSRSVIIRMRRRHAGERVEPYRRRQHAAFGAEIRRQIECWARLRPEIIDWPFMPEGIQDRDADVWEPLLAVADLVGGAWPVRAREAAKVLVAASKETEPSYMACIVRQQDGCCWPGRRRRPGDDDGAGRAPPPRANPQPSLALSGGASGVHGGGLPVCFVV